MQALTGEWAQALAPELQKEYCKSLWKTVEREYAQHTVYPPEELIFSALELTPLGKVKVVILGQDPYHEEGQAQGLCFSVPEDVKIPPSLVNIYKELHEDLGCEIPAHGNLTHWAQQGVLLLNTLLSVRAHEAFSHKGMGWEQFTDAIIRLLNEQDRPMVFMLWGGPAQKKGAMLNNPQHLVLKASHPSPLSVYRGFWGCKHFSKCNAFLREKGEEEIDWQII